MQASKVDDSGKINVFDLKVPLVLALGQLEKLTNDELKEHANDVAAEIRRRQSS